MALINYERVTIKDMWSKFNENKEAIMEMVSLYTHWLEEGKKDITSDYLDKIKVYIPNAYEFEEDFKLVCTCRDGDLVLYFEEHDGQFYLAGDTRYL